MRDVSLDACVVAGHELSAVHLNLHGVRSLSSDSRLATFQIALSQTVVVKSEWTDHHPRAVNIAGLGERKDSKVSRLCFISPI